MNLGYRSVCSTIAVFAALAVTAMARPSGELIYVDPHGILRWRTSDVEVAMLGANYCLPSASDYRAAGQVTSDRKTLIDEDMTHFARMGWDALRLSFWGDWECCDRDGNLVENDHLDLLDYLIFRAKQRDLHMLLSPIVTYDSSWPGPQDPAAVGFSRYYPKGELGTNPKAIAAQVNYLKQLLNHVSPYTHLAIKDEPYVCFIELINEPTHHPEDLAGSVRYINTLVDAVRSTGCQKITFYNVSQNFAIGKAIMQSKADGLSFGWYPSGLVSGHELRGNFLRSLESYPPMNAPEISGKPRLVYEYDLPDVMSGYHYPAMAQTFRAAGAQSAAMFSYDMLATAPYNLGWQTHCLNMVYTPQKAASAIIASQVMRRIPLYQPVGPYPSNLRFGDFRVSYERNLSELVSRDLYLYSNDTDSRPPAPSELRRVVGFGSSPVVRYEGRGLYFLDRLDVGAWRLEVYPDSIQIDDPFAPVSAGRLVFKLISRPWPMTVKLPDLGDAFTIEPLNDGNTWSTRAGDGSFEVRPGAYILLAAAHPRPYRIPERLPGVPYYLGVREFVCPAPSVSPPALVLHAPEIVSAGTDAAIRATIASGEFPNRVVLHLAEPGKPERSFAMERSLGYDYSVTIPAAAMAAGSEATYTIEASFGSGSLNFPRDSPVASTRADAFRISVVDPASGLGLLDARRDAALFSFSRIGEHRRGAARTIPGRTTGEEAVVVDFPGPALPEDYTASLFIGDRIAERADAARSASVVRVEIKALAAPSVVHLTLVDRDGSAWSAKVPALPEWKTIDLPLASFVPSRSVMLPQGYPGTWAYWLAGDSGRALDPERLERLQISMRKDDFGSIMPDPSMCAVALERVELCSR